MVNVADGDTITVLRGTEQTRVHLYGVDTPEKKQAYGAAAHPSLTIMAFPLYCM